MTKQAGRGGRRQIWNSIHHVLGFCGTMDHVKRVGHASADQYARPVLRVSMVFQEVKLHTSLQRVKGMLCTIPEIILVDSAP